MTSSQLPKPSDRVIEQRIRNREMEILLGLAAGDDEVREIGFREWFESFFDFFPYEGKDEQVNSAHTDDERSALAQVLDVMQAACRETPSTMTDEELVRSGWPLKVQPVATKALNLMRERGRFSEEVEEIEPSTQSLGPSVPLA